MLSNQNERVLKTLFNIKLVSDNNKNYNENKIINLIDELNKISIKELVEVRKEKYLNITSDI